MIEYRLNLRSLYTWEPFQEFLNRCSVPEILEKSRNRHPGSTKYPNSTDLVWIAFNSFQCFPLFHIAILWKKRRADRCPDYIRTR